MIKYLLEIMNSSKSVNSWWITVLNKSLIQSQNSMMWKISIILFYLRHVWMLQIFSLALVNLLLRFVVSSIRCSRWVIVIYRKTISCLVKRISSVGSISIKVMRLLERKKSNIQNRKTHELLLYYRKRLKLY
jgi:hypothetical protein